MEKIIIGLCMLAASCAHADSIYLGAWSKHFTPEDKNERHDLFAVQSGNWIAGTFKNSYSRRTHLVGRKFDVLDYRDFNFRVYAGATYGYTKCYGEDPASKPRTCAALVPELAYTKYRVQPAVLIFGHAVALSFKFKFGPGL